MRHGNYARLDLSKSGNLIAFGTGSDACSEHECGSESLQTALSGAYDNDSDLIRRLKAGESIGYPSVLERKTLTKNLDNVQFIEVPAVGDKPTQAILGYDGGRTLSHDNNELHFPSFKSDHHDSDASGAWDQYSFALRVRGKKYVEALREFHQGLKAGQAVFAGTFIRGKELQGGIILADLRYLDNESRAAIKSAQAYYESTLRLKARDDTRSLVSEMAVLSKSKGHRSPGHIWALWKDEQESEVVYGLNPSYDCQRNADYYGPYTREQLLGWARAGYKTQLNRQCTAAAA